MGFLEEQIVHRTIIHKDFPLNPPPKNLPTLFLLSPSSYLRPPFTYILALIRQNE